jgi:SAM-dependent methyltransferase
MNPFENWQQWTHTPLGLKLLAEEQAWLDETLQDVFGYNALQIAPPALDALRLSRMTCRAKVVWAPQASNDALEPSACSAIQASLDSLPFLTQSLDLLVLAHGLEVAPDPHQLLREAERVLIPEGRLVITGFNPLSLWALRKRCRSVNRFPPAGHQWIGLPRLKDWLKLLSFDVGAGSASAYGAYVPPFDSPKWLDRMAWMGPAGRRWWPMAGGVYFLMAIKRVQGMRVIGPVWRKPARAGQAVVATSSVRARSGLEN